MVQSKADRERQKLITDKCQSLIEVLLKEDDNKYCVDCDAKGPRWASWNLGVFLCIRCAGIHRNLGVHISKVKSVNLDAWTPDHVAYVQRMGNSRARAIYEANLPDDFRRPQTDTALESFIRAKYEHKKYIAQDYVDPGPPLPAFNIEEEIKKIKEQKKGKISSGSTRMISITDLPTNSKPRPAETPAIKSKVKSIPGLVDFETVAATEAINKSQNASTSVAAPLGDIASSPAANNNNNNSTQSAIDLLIGIDLDSSLGDTMNTSNLKTNNSSQQQSSLAFFDSPIPATQSAASSNNILDLDLDFTSASSPQTSATAPDSSKKVLTKESILSLYSLSPSNTPAAAVAPVPAASVGIQAAKDPFGFADWSKYQ